MWAAKELERRGAHMLAIKDMSGLLKPYAAKKLVSTLKQEVGLPIHLHTHDTTGNQVAALLMAAEAGVDVVDAACARWRASPASPSRWTRWWPPCRARSGTPAWTCAACRSSATTGPTCACAREFRPRPEDQYHRHLPL